MLVEDDKSLRDIYNIRLAAEGYTTALASDGEEALSVVVQEKPDLIIADVMMPKISGFDMLDILRSQPETKNIKVIMMTALSSDEQRQRGEALGAEKYLVKSQVGIEDVVNAVHEVLGDAPNANAQANLDMTKAISEKEQAEKQSSTPVASTNSTVVEPASQDAPAAPEAPQGPLATPQNGDQSVNFNQAPATMPAAQAMPYAQPVAGAFYNGAPTPQMIAVQTVPVMQTAPIMQQNAMQPIATSMQTAAPTPQPTVQLPQPNMVQNALAENAIRLQMPGANPTADQVIQQANLQAIQQMYSQLSTQNSTLKPADRILPNAQVAEAAAQKEREAAEKREKGASERIIQPIHDPSADQRRDEMQKRMAAVLGEDPDAEEAQPQAINTKTAKNTKLEMKIQTADEASRAVPVDAAQVVQQAMPKTTEAAAQNVQQAVAQTAPAAEEPQPTAQQNSEPSPVQAALQAQQAQAQAQQTEEAQAQSQEQAEAAVQTDETTQKAAGIEKITADTKIPTIDEIEDPGVDVQIKVAVPGYLSDLEDELSSDLATSDKVDPNSMAARMNAELLGDEVTAAAKEKAEAEIAARKAAAEELIKNPARQVKQNTNISPNIQGAAANPASAPQPTTATPATPPAAPAQQGAPAPQAGQQPQAQPTPAATQPQTQPTPAATQPQAQPAAQPIQQIIQPMGPQDMGAIS